MRVGQAGGIATKLKNEKISKEKEAEYLKNPVLCPWCKEPISFGKYRRKRKYCSRHCSCADRCYLGTFGAATHKAETKERRSNIDINEAQWLYDQGMTLLEVAEHYGVSTCKMRWLGIKTRTYSEATTLRFKVKPISEKTRAKLSAHAKNMGLGHSPNKGKGSLRKSGVWRNGTWLDSSYEVTVAEELDSNDVRWERPKRGFSWGEHKYYPDFYLPEYGVYLDPKNDYLIKKDAEKIRLAQEMNGIKVIVLNKHNLTWEKISKIIAAVV